VTLVTTIVGIHAPAHKALLAHATRSKKCVPWIVSAMNTASVRMSVKVTSRRIKIT